MRFDLSDSIFYLKGLLPDGVFLPKNKFFQIHPKGKDEVNDNRRWNGDKGKINEKQPDIGHWYAHPFAKIGAHTKHHCFY